MQEVTTIVVLAAGKGTRLYPFTSVIPKELFPIVDRPVIQYVLEEAIVPGIREVVLVVNAQKRLVVDYLRSNNSREFQKLLAGVTLTIVNQPNGSYGSGAALLAAREHLSDGPFLVLFGDSFGLRQDGRVPSLLKTHQMYRSPVVSLIRISERGLSLYGIPKIKKKMGNKVIIEGIVEKPGPAFKGELLAAPNGYIVTLEVFSYLEALRPAESGEVSFPESLSFYQGKTTVYGDIFEGPFFEAGNPEDVIQSTLEMARHRPDLALTGPD